MIYTVILYFYSTSTNRMANTVGNRFYMINLSFCRERKKEQTEFFCYDRRQKIQIPKFNLKSILPLGCFPFILYKTQEKQFSSEKLFKLK